VSAVAEQGPLLIEPERIDRVCAESEIYRDRLPLAGAHLLELGCGAADHTRALAALDPSLRITALEVDERQHAKNCRAQHAANIEFKPGGAEAIPADAATFDIVVMFKSLHHVPESSLGAAMREIHRVLVDDGLAYISEPIFAGPFNDILKLFHDEQHVRRAAFAAITAAVAAGLFESVEQIFFRAPVFFADFADFERKIIGATHTEHSLDAATYAEVKSRMEAAAGADGIRFEAPMRIDLLRKRS
jgi:SAM-dependent methyltransferase